VGLVGAGIMIVFVRETLRPAAELSSNDRSAARGPNRESRDEPRSPPNAQADQKRE
jgi:hypothetical protein